MEATDALLIKEEVDQIRKQFWSLSLRPEAVLWRQPSWVAGHGKWLPDWFNVHIFVLGGLNSISPWAQLVYPLDLGLNDWTTQTLVSQTPLCANLQQVALSQSPTSTASSEVASRKAKSYVTPSASGWRLWTRCCAFERANPIHVHRDNNHLRHGHCLLFLLASKEISFGGGLVLCCFNDHPNLYGPQLSLQLSRYIWIGSPTRSLRTLTNAFAPGSRFHVSVALSHLSGNPQKPKTDDETVQKHHRWDPKICWRVYENVFEAKCRGKRSKKPSKYHCSCKKAPHPRRDGRGSCSPSRRSKASTSRKYEARWRKGRRWRKG